MASSIDKVRGRDLAKLLDLFIQVIYQRPDLEQTIFCILVLVVIEVQVAGKF